MNIFQYKTPESRTDRVQFLLLAKDFACTGLERLASLYHWELSTDSRGSLACIKACGV